VTTRPGALRVLHILGRLERGGAELRTVELAEAFPPDLIRSDVLVLTGLGGVLDDRIKRAGGDVIKCRLGARFPRTFYRLLRERRYDVVHSHVHYFSGVILALAKLAGVPSRVAHFHTAVVNDRGRTLRRRAQLAICHELIHRTATDIVAVGEETMDGAWRPDWRADVRCRVIHMGVRPDRLHSVRRVPPRTPTVVNVASVQPLKNQVRLVDVLSRLLARVPGVQLRLIGREIGDYGREVRQAVAAAGLTEHVRLVGEVEEPMQWMASADVMVLPSLWEGLPCAALEACAIGTPVLASDLPGTRELARYFPHMHVMSLGADDDAWAEAVARLIAQGSRAASQAAEHLARSPFVFDRSCEAHYEMWSRSRATA
jgi:glycosyltransferase involved in cell wall biosynthesis